MPINRKWRHCTTCMVRTDHKEYSKGVWLCDICMTKWEPSKTKEAVNRVAEKETENEPE
jgi:ribosomal protein L37AE/L43A